MRNPLLKYFTFLLIAVCCCTLLFSQRYTYNFNPGWKVWKGDDKKGAEPLLEDKDWKQVTLPNAWNEDEAFQKDIKDLGTGIAWYRKHFKLPATQKGQKIFLEFEGIRQAGTFYLNGTYIGQHENGVTAFGFDITELVNFGDTENVLAARIDNDWEYKERSTNTKFQWEDKNFNANYGGINKNVYLHVTPKIYQTIPLFSSLGTTGVYIYADAIDVKKRSAVLHAQSEIKNESAAAQEVQYQVIVTDLLQKPVIKFSGEKKQVAAGATTTLSAEALLSGLNFWSWGYGYLYNVETILLVNGRKADRVLTRTGFRKTAFENGMIWLNDRVMLVHGYAQRTSNEWPAIGLSVPAWLSDYSNGLMVEGNANLVRWMHITPWRQDVESCDRVGLLQAMPAGDAEKDVEGIRWEQRKSVMRDAIIYFRNNPSILFYECGNESISDAHMQEMKVLRDQYDPKGGRAIGSREMLDSKVAEYGGEMLYTNKSADIPLWAMEYSRDEGLRKYWDDFTPPFHKDGEGPLHNGQDASAYNRNMESHAVENVKRWYEFWKERPGTGKRVSAGGVNIIFSETNTHHRGAENYRRSGEVDALRIRKQNFYANQVMWDGWVNPEKPGIHIIGHWNYAAAVVKNIYVVSSAAKVELFINDQPADTGQKSDGFLFTFKNIGYQPGTVRAIGYDENGKQLCRTEINTAGKAVALRLTEIKRPLAWKADGHDLALVEVEVVDAKGKRCPAALNTVQFTTDGPVEWRGGMAQGPGNYILSKILPVETGVNRVLLRSETKAGTIILTAKAEGLAPAQLKLQTVPFAVTNGMSTVLPAADLHSSLRRGPTPAGKSYTPLRKTVPIIAAKAGANADSAFASYDDNELSDWVNDGKLQTAWIEYELERPALVSEVSLKLNNFRSRSYPLLITVDGQIVFNDSTQKSLGYFNAVCRPRMGKKVRIELNGSSVNSVITATEVSGKKLDDGVARNDAGARGTLSVIEAEIYEAIRYKQ